MPYKRVSYSIFSTLPIFSFKNIKFHNLGNFALAGNISLLKIRRLWIKLKTLLCQILVAVTVVSSKLADHQHYKNKLPCVQLNFYATLFVQYETQNSFVLASVRTQNRKTVLYIPSGMFYFIYFSMKHFLLQQHTLQDFIELTIFS